MNWFVKKSCPLVNDKKSNVRCTSPDKRRGTPRRMTWPATAQRWDPLLGELARILGTSSSPASTRGLAYISSDVCCSSYILRAPTVLVVSTRKYFVISYFLLRQQKQRPLSYIRPVVLQFQTSCLTMEPAPVFVSFMIPLTSQLCGNG
jgi:hypothetical protein